MLEAAIIIGGAVTVALVYYIAWAIRHPQEPSPPVLPPEPPLPPELPAELVIMYRSLDTYEPVEGEPVPITLWRTDDGTWQTVEATVQLPGPSKPMLAERFKIRSGFYEETFPIYPYRVGGPGDTLTLTITDD